jgi:hypothetical protein
MKSDPNVKKSISARARAERIKQFSRLIADCALSNATVLDIGGTPEFWRMNAEYIPKGLIGNIDVVNLPPVNEQTEVIRDIYLRVYAGDALNSLNLHLDHYDIIHSNSVIEHVGNLRSQHIMAKTIQEAGHYFWVQTPAKTFLLEPHSYVPLFPYLPLFARTWIYQHFRLGYMGKEPDWLKARMKCEEMRLLTKRELKLLFPGATLFKERMYGLVKAYIITNMTTRSIR